MNIGIDVRPLLDPIKSGVPEYTRILLEHLFQTDKQNQYFLLYNVFNREFERNLPSWNYPNVFWHATHFPNKIFNLSGRVFGFPKFDKMIENHFNIKLDLFICFNYELISLSSNLKKIVVAHDLSFMVNPSWSSLKRRLKQRGIMNPKRFFNGAEIIVAVSENTKRDLVDFYNISEEKIKVIYPGVVVPPSVIPRSISDEESRGRSPASGGINSATTHEINGSPVTSAFAEASADAKALADRSADRSFPRDSSVALLPQNDNFEAVKQKFNLPPKFIFSLGTIEPRKNILGIIKAFEVWQKKQPPLSPPISAERKQGELSARGGPALGGEGVYLVLAGARGWLSGDVWKAIESSPLKDKIKYLGYVSEDEKFALYRLAKLFLYPSFYEGFGLPPLEAMGCGVPVIASANSSFPEVLGDAALLVNPYDINDIANGIETVLGSSEIRNQFIQKGLEQIKKFSWQKAAEEWLNLVSGLKI